MSSNPRNLHFDSRTPVLLRHGEHSHVFVGRDEIPTSCTADPWQVPRRVGFVLLALSGLVVAASHAASEQALAKIGEKIYRTGILSSSEALVSVREGGIVTKGADAACINCHQRSGLGAREGQSAIPPVTGRYLYQPRATTGRVPDLPYVEGMHGEREPYTDASVARAIRDGINSEGKSLSYLMPRFSLGDADMEALIAYLKSLDQRKIPGVRDATLHFATIITADADPIKRRGMLDVMNQFFTDRNARQMTNAPPIRASNKTAYVRSMNMIHYQWQLHVWELTGAASTWQDQLQRHFADEPVLAVLSGLAGKDWTPVQAFCETASLPCLFPNVEAPPVDADADFYTVYLSKGVLLEAELIAKRIRASGTVKSVRQIYRAGDTGESGSVALAVALKKDGINATSHVIAADAPVEQVADAVAGAGDALVLWLRPADISALKDPPGESTSVFLSGLMGGLERAPLPTEWRSRVHMAYGVDLPDKRRVRVDYAMGWFSLRHIPVVDQKMQADTYLVCGLVSETLKHMVDNYTQAYLVERLQNMLEHRVLTGYYPRLTLATGQRFASKGGYMVHFLDDKGTRLVADQEWIVP